MATLTISLNNGVYSVSEDPMNIPVGEDLTIVVPQGPPVGCLICLDNNLGNSKSYVLTANRTFDTKNLPENSTWGYDVLAPTASCPQVNKRNASHSIQITSHK